MMFVAEGLARYLTKSRMFNSSFHALYYTDWLTLPKTRMEAYWMLPSHILAANVRFTNPSATQVKREAMTHWVRRLAAKHG